MTTTDTDIPAFLDRRKPKPFVWTYSNLNCYDDICPHQFFRRYIKKDLPFVETPQMKEGNAIHTAFELRVGGQKPLPEAYRHWEPFASPFDGLKTKVELKVAITRKGEPCAYFSDDVWGRGKIDVAVLSDKVAFINDWKSGSSKYEKPFELELHAMMLKALLPQLEKISGAYCWLKDNRMGTSYDLSDFGGTWARVNNIVEQIEDDLKTNEFEKRRGPLCGWCDVFDCENNTNPKRP